MLLFRASAPALAAITNCPGMKLIETTLPDLWIIECSFFPDTRGFFAPAWIADDLDAVGLSSRVWQCALAFNHHRGTIRGMHYQAAPMAESKTVRVIRGAVWDVAVDLRPESPTFRQWVGTELSADNRRSMYVPEGFAHGYQTLTDDAELLYLISERYSPAHQRGVRWNDPIFGIEWPLGPPTQITERDATYADFTASAPS